MMENTKQTSGKEKKTLKKTQKDMIFVACLVALPLIHYAIFYVYVNFNSLLLSFQIYVDGSYYWTGLTNFERLFQEFVREELLFVCLKNSLIYYVIYTAVGTTFCLFFSFYIFKKRFMSKFFKVILFLPSVISSIAITLMFKYFTNFAIPAMFETMGVRVDGLLSSVSTRFATIVFYGVWVGFGTSLLMYSGAMSNISDSVVEASQIDGANEFRQFFNVSLPLIYPTITTFLISGVAAIFTSDMHLYAFFGGGAERYVWTFGYYLLKLTRDAGMDGYPYPAAIGLLLTCFSVPLTLFIRWCLQKFGPKVD